jgi:hypothetical protein
METSLVWVENEVLALLLMKGSPEIYSDFGLVPLAMHFG